MAKLHTTLRTIAASPPQKNPALKRSYGGLRLLFVDRRLAETHTLYGRPGIKSSKNRYMIDRLNKYCALQLRLHR